MALLSGLPTLTSGSVSRVAATLARFTHIFYSCYEFLSRPLNDSLATSWFKYGLDPMPFVQVYAIRQALSKSLVAYYQKYVDEQSKQEIKDILVQFDRYDFSTL